LGLQRGKDVGHVEGGWDVDLLEVSVVCDKGGQAKRGLKVQTNEDRSLSSMGKVGVPEILGAVY
jgi:hypothetical protein